MSKLQKYFKAYCVLPFWLGFIILYLIIGAASSMAYGPLYGTVICDLIMAILGYLIMKNIFHNQKWTQFNYFKDTAKTTKNDKILTVISLVFLLIIIAIVGQVLGSLLGIKIGHGDFKNYTQIAKSNPLLYTMSAIFIAPICEEIMYRGVIFEGLIKRFIYRMKVKNKNYSDSYIKFSYICFWLLQAMIFSLMHGTVEHLPGTFLLALFNGLVFIKSGNLFYAVLSHFGYNLFAMFVIYLPNVKWLFNLPIMIFAFVMVIFILCLIYYQQIKFSQGKNW